MWQGRIWPPTTFSIFYWLLSKTCSVTSAPQSWDSEMRYSSAVWHGFALPVRLTAPMPYSANSAVVVKMFRWLRQVFKPSWSLFPILTTQEENVHITWRTRFVFNPGHRRVQDLSFFFLFVCWSNICIHQPNELLVSKSSRKTSSAKPPDETTTIRNDPKMGGVVFFWETKSCSLLSPIIKVQWIRLPPQLESLAHLGDHPFLVPTEPYDCEEKTEENNKQKQRSFNSRMLYGLFGPAGVH